jgi:DNA-directed RNA polymerase specialized sigma24 family protein
MSADLPGRQPGHELEDHWFDDEAGPLVRAFALTGGRARTNTVFDLLAHVVATDAARSMMGGLPRELRDILTYADRPVSVAEVASHVDLPLGTVRVLLSDLLERDAIAIHEPESVSYLPADHVLTAVINGLRAL